MRQLSKESDAKTLPRRIRQYIDAGYTVVEVSPADKIKRIEHSRYVGAYLNNAYFVIDPQCQAQYKKRKEYVKQGTSLPYGLMP